ncbi:Vasoactive intestinal polypeptide [Brachionus plicatilis]|uniref:Vasoactive intestinal polypeptide n=1 Tax=Brachionus plicatilis TaxID=10195 RepID=A0A3M7S675_BRAPC|nr:Vasoactive intestinal polypeptide [Brachionus plicatilis]
MQPHGSNITQYLSANGSDGKFNLCRFSMTIFRYSASVYSVAITTEAFYLMLLLKFPYYSEKKGSKFCIIISWVLPFLWILPWIFIRIYVENKWCWQMESIWNLLIDAPNTILTILNVLCAIFVIRTLYSKIIGQSVSPEKVIKYRRLAKSILIIIPIFGVHFIIFEWLPYFRVATEDSLLELPLVYMEIIFNGLQGLLASVACCFVQKEAQIETLILVYNILDEEYIRSIKYSREFRSRSIHENTRIKRSDSTVDSATDVIFNRPKIEIKRMNSRRRSSVVMYNWSSRFCCCLFSNQKNDFYQNGHRRSTLLSLTDNTSLAKNFKRLRNSSSLTSFFTRKTISEKSFKTKSHKICSQPEPVSRLDSVNSEDLNNNLFAVDTIESSDTKIAINNLIIHEEDLGERNTFFKSVMNETNPSASKEEVAIQIDKKDQSRYDESSGSEDPYANYDSDNKNSNRSEVENETVEKKESNEIKNQESESDTSSSNDSQSDSKIQSGKSKLKKNNNKRPNKKEKKEQKRHKKNQEMTNNRKDVHDISKSQTKLETNTMHSNYDSKDNNRFEVENDTAEKKSLNEIKNEERESETKTETKPKTKSETLYENISRDKNESLKEQRINLRFYVYAPPEFNVDLKTCCFGILHNLGEWKPENMIKLNFRKFENGFLITGDHSFNVKHNKLEYKYCLVANNDYEVEPFIEYYQGFKTNRILNFANFSPDKFHSIYDGIMLPPDEGNLSSWKQITKSIVMKFVKRYFTDEMSENYLEDTIKAMLHEIPTINKDDERIKKFKYAKDYMIAIIDSIYKSFKKIKNDDLLKVFYS